MTKKKNTARDKAMARIERYCLNGVRALDKRNSHEARYWLGKQMEIVTAVLREDFKKFPKPIKTAITTPNETKPRRFWHLFFPFLP